MSNDMGIVVRKHKDKWQVRNICMSNAHESLISEHATRAEAIERAATEAEYPVEYGIVHIDSDDPVIGLVSINPKAITDVSNPPGTNPINTEVSNAKTFNRA